MVYVVGACELLSTVNAGKVILSIKPYEHELPNNTLKYM